MTPNRGEDGDLFYLPNIGQSVAFADLKSTHTAAVSVLLPPRHTSGWSWFCKMELAVGVGVLLGEPGLTAPVHSPPMGFWAAPVLASAQRQGNLVLSWSQLGKSS